jgi:hypothetical protein
MRRLALLLFVGIAAAAVPSTAAAQVVEGRISGGATLVPGALELAGGAEVRLPVGFGIAQGTGLFGVAGGTGLLVLEGAPQGILWIDGVVHSERTPPRRGISVFAAAGVTYPEVFAEGRRRSAPHVRLGANYWRGPTAAVLLEVVVMPSDRIVLRAGLTFRRTR